MICRRDGRGLLHAAHKLQCPSYAVLPGDPAAHQSLALRRRRCVPPPPTPRPGRSQNRRLRGRHGGQQQGFASEVDTCATTALQNCPTRWTRTALLAAVLAPAVCLPVHVPSRARSSPHSPNCLRLRCRLRRPPVVAAGPNSASHSSSSSVSSSPTCSAGTAPRPCGRATVREPAHVPR